MCNMKYYYTYYSGRVEYFQYFQGYFPELFYERITLTESPLSIKYMEIWGRNFNDAGGISTQNLI